MISEALVSDVHRLVEIETACFEAEYSDKMLSETDFAELIESTYSKILIYSEFEIILGYGLLIYDQKNHRASFDSLAIFPDFQGRGIGGEIFRGIEEQAKIDRMVWLDLEIKETNYTLLRRYHSFGYRCFRCVENFYSDGASALNMTKKILNQSAKL